MTRDAVQSLVDAVDRILPQTQCTRCGYSGCRPYADAVVRDAAPINRCPPGGAAGIERLSALLGRPVLALDPACGVEAPRRVARIVADLCIGCTKCIQACPVDAIAGTSKRLHAVIPELCTGCDLCVPPCPVDCIEMIELGPQERGWTAADADAARERHRRRASRLQRRDGERIRSGAPKAVAAATSAASQPAPPQQDDAAARKRAVIDAAIARARARLETQR